MHMLQFTFYPYSHFHSVHYSDAVFFKKKEYIDIPNKVHPNTHTHKHAYVYQQKKEVTIILYKNIQYIICVVVHTHDGKAHPQPCNICLNYKNLNTLKCITLVTFNHHYCCHSTISSGHDYSNCPTASY